MDAKSSDRWEHRGDIALLCFSILVLSAPGFPGGSFIGDSFYVEVHKALVNYGIAAAVVVCVGGIIAFRRRSWVERAPGLLMVAIGLIAMAFAIIGCGSNYRELERSHIRLRTRATCAHVTRALKSYSQDHEGNFPPSIYSLVPDYLTETEAAPSLPDTHGSSGFIYYRPVRPPTARVIVLQSNAVVFSREARKVCCGFSDGTVEWEDQP